MRRHRPGRRRALAAGIAAAWVASGCTAVGPDFHRPEVPWLDAAPAPTPAATALAGKLDQWWRLFNDPVLDALVAEAQRSNPTVRIAGARILESRAALGIAGSGLYPQLQQASANALRSGEQVSDGEDSTISSWRAGFDIAWELDFWGKFRRGIEAADANYFATIAQYDDVQVLVASQAADFYSTIRTLELRLRIAHDNADLQKRSLEITERLFQSGNESELDVQQARSLYLSTLASIPQLESNTRRVQNALCVLLGRPPGALPEMAAGREHIPDTSLDIAVEIPADLLRHRPDVRSAENLLAAQSALIGVSRAQLYPSIALVGSLGLTANSLDWSSQTLSWALGPTLSWNIFDHGRLRNDVLVQDARFQQLYESYQSTVLGAAREVDDATVSFVKNREQVVYLEQAVEAARRSLDIANVQYKEGLVDFERVLDSQRTLFNQEDRLVSTRGDVASSLVAFFKATGGGWQGHRGQPVLDERTRKEMAARSDWNTLIDAPMPRLDELVPPSVKEPP